MNETATRRLAERHPRAKYVTELEKLRQKIAGDDNTHDGAKDAAGGLLGRLKKGK